MGNLGNEEKQGSIFKPKAHAYRLSATLQKRATYLDALPAYILWNTQKRWMELCPHSAPSENVVILDWLAVYMYYDYIGARLAVQFVKSPVAQEDNSK